MPHRHRQNPSRPTADRGDQIHRSLRTASTHGAAAAPLMGDLLFPQQTFLWILRAGFAQRPPGIGLTRSLLPQRVTVTAKRATGGAVAPGYGVIESAVGTGDAPDVWAAAKTVAQSLNTPLPALENQTLTDAERRLLTVGWALQTGARIGGWPRLLADLPPAAHASALAALTLIVHVLGERGHVMPAPADRPATAGPTLRNRPGLAGAPASARALIQALRLMRRGGPGAAGRDPLSAAAGHLTRQGLPMAVAGGIDTLLVEAAAAAGRGEGALPQVHAVGCPCLSRDEAALVQAVATGVAPAGGWLPSGDPVVDATLQAMNADLALPPPTDRKAR